MECNKLRKIFQAHLKFVLGARKLFVDSLSATLQLLGFLFFLFLKLLQKHDMYTSLYFAWLPICVETFHPALPFLSLIFLSPERSCNLLSFQRWVFQFSWLKKRVEEEKKRKITQHVLVIFYKFVNNSSSMSFCHKLLNKCLKHLAKVSIGY